MIKVFCQKREAFTQNTISKVYSQYPKYNWVICHSPYSVSFEGVEGTDWGYTHHELGISFGRTVGSVLLYLSSIYIFVSSKFFFSYTYFLNRYDLYWATEGTFYRYGDGGFMNVRIPSFKSYLCASTMILINILLVGV